MKREYPSGIGTRPIPAKHNNTRAGRPIPSEHQGFGHLLLLLIGSGRRHQRLLAGVFVIQSSCLYQSSVFIPGEAYSHQWPRCGERFLGRYTPVERFRGRLREWRLGELNPRCCEGPGKRFLSVRPGSGMSTTVGGRSPRFKAAVSGRAASMASLVSGRTARGSGYTIPGLCLPASLASLKGSVIKCLEGDPEKGLVGGCWRAGEERPNPEKLSL